MEPWRPSNAGSPSLSSGRSVRSSPLPSKVVSMRGPAPGQGPASGMCGWLSPSGGQSPTGRSLPMDRMRRWTGLRTRSTGCASPSAAACGARAAASSRHEDQAITCPRMNPRVWERAQGRDSRPQMQQVPPRSATQARHALWPPKCAKEVAHIAAMTCQQIPSVVFHPDRTLSSAARARRTLSRMSFAFAVQTKGMGSLLC
jgi:hypothetical protein